MRVLHLTLKKKWFDLIASGEKKEEYREIKYYWEARFKYHCNYQDMLHEYLHDYTHILFKNGYSKTAPTMLIEFLSTDIKEGKEEWGAEKGERYFVLELGEIIQPLTT